VVKFVEEAREIQFVESVSCGVCGRGNCLELSLHGGYRGTEVLNGLGIGRNVLRRHRVVVLGWRGKEIWAV
jgi:hypothetical protein